MSDRPPARQCPTCQDAGGQSVPDKKVVDGITVHGATWRRCGTCKGRGTV